MNDSPVTPAVVVPKVKQPKSDRPKVAKAPAKKVVKKQAKPAARKKVAKKAAKRRAFPYLRVAKLWARGKTIESIARSIGRFEKSADDPLHSMRCFLHRMHSVGYLNGNGKRTKLPHRVSRKSVQLSRKAGKKAA